eukprot:gnl/TRDRNA2_/TRDRNA2_158765_c1_seq1.p1 gnl/TRDRNA2_/TRDRNA2_158765_c1~~gnl/TRDRNA2_/TRDRNA2_158765_c1_seq1.p1  ORF type:complete len:205 (+),score=15.02 gnl/TRDRNA2_/TRDRNA2_158765_c1_seq1:2-616(+)
MGNITWSMSMSPIKLQLGDGPQTALAASICSPTCGVLFDTGTSLIAVPDSMYDIINQHLQEFFGGGSQDCQVSKIPDLVFTIAGHDFRLPPRAFVHSKQIQAPNHYQCHLALMKTHTRTAFGPLIILGMPFFRTYYTTFDLGNGSLSTQMSRNIHVAEADSNCDPNRVGISSIGRATEASQMMKPVDFSKVLFPHWLNTSKVDL